MTSKEKKPFYITTTIPYVNADPHIGFALELVQTDAIARYQRLSGKDVFFSTGTDEYGQKILEASQKEGKDAQEYVDHYAAEFKKLKNALGISNDTFVRTTSEHHKKAAQEMWRRCGAKGDIYKKSYTGNYCVGCESFKTEKDLNAGRRCFLHPNLEISILQEENYFFRFSKYQNKLLEYLSRPDVILPDWRKEEAIAFVKSGLEDFSISREKKRLGWGVPVPDDADQVIYVWFDALTNYISTLGWPADAKALAGRPEENLFEKFWQKGEVVQMAGKDQVRFQSIMWQAMLMSADIKNTDKVVYHGFITSGGQKMSKSLGNVINPLDLAKEYGTEAVRYFLLRHVHPFEDSDVTPENIKEAYNANLANGLGNLASRILTLSEKYLDKCPEIPEKSDFTEYFEFFEKFDIKQAADYVWNEIGELDKFIQKTEPFKVVKIDEKKGKELISSTVLHLYRIARMLNPIMPETNIMLKKLIKENKKPEKPLFLRKD
ncbi:MAG: Methionine-tRNA ligase [Candidatus Nomurabacteria bacterium GW2011_GWA2_41_25]|uniref:Methionine--tRNA ligase n=2 Tax=Candidatus Nomuraibacteriota TaxID=1752729 RepID=A0A0G0VVZ9_9BACT|nr:MAG: Methionine-tRNA ligase [Candidatus Nomurabacteria bacterium GW2011_GWA2_41_25]